MILLSSVIDQFESDFLNTYQGQVLPAQRKAFHIANIMNPSSGLKSSLKNNCLVIILC